mmetsp:Transcript_25228/g.81538  ORF Transcript_25228/g.81538 Transcript_25228/m.81538 type:complete len:1013 (-) Transcript_25228:473-3511(-)
MPLTTCSKCPLGTFQPSTGEEVCKYCGDHAASGTTTLFLAADDVSNCICPTETLLNLEGTSCLPCPEGLSCLGGMGPPKQARGYFAEPVTGAFPDVWQCSIPQACPEGDLAACSSGATGRMCLKCAEADYFWDHSSNRCTSCAHSGAWLLLLACTVVVIVLMVVVYAVSLSWGNQSGMSEPMEVGIAMSLMLLLGQTSSVYNGMDIPWGYPIKDVLRVTQVFHLEVRILHIECSLGLNYRQGYILAVIIPAIIFFIYFLVTKILQRFDYKDVDLRCWNAIGMINQGFFIGFLLHGITPFLITKHPNGKRTVRIAGEVVVGTPEHSELAAAATLSLLVYSFGFLAYSIFAVFRIRARQRMRAHRGIKAIMWHRFLFVRFKPDRYYWGVVQLVRSLVFALIPVIVASPHGQVLFLGFACVVFIVLQSRFWPYQSHSHNLADVSICIALLAFDAAAAFYLPADDNWSVIVVFTMSALGLCLVTLFCDLGVVCVREVRRRMMTSDQRAQNSRLSMKRSTSFMAALQKVDKKELAVVESESVDLKVDFVCARPPPRLTIHELLQGFGMCGLDEDEEAHVTLLAPSEHPYIKDVMGCLRVLEDRLRSRVLDDVDQALGGARVTSKGTAGYRSMWSNRVSSHTHSGGSLVMDQLAQLQKQRLDGAVWTQKEREWVVMLSDVVLGFQKAYLGAFYEQPEAVLALEKFVERMERQFTGVYKACVTDMLMVQPGYAKAVGMARVLQQMSQVKSYGMQAEPRDAAGYRSDRLPLRTASLGVVGRGRYAGLMEAAVRTQEATVLFAQDLAEATNGEAPRTGSKRLYRILEKQALDPTAAETGKMKAWDASRMMVLYDNMEDLARGVELICSHHSEGHVRVLRVKERFSEPTSGGWSDVLVNLCFPKATLPRLAAIPFELQLAHKQLMVIRSEMGGHHGYAKYRAAKEILEFLAAQSPPSSRASTPMGCMDSVPMTRQMFRSPRTDPQADQPVANRKPTPTRSFTCPEGLMGVVPPVTLPGALIV